MDKEFDYDSAFSRNIGWVTPQEQAILRDKRIAIAGLGGVGGSHLLTLTRLGITKFNLADFDTFELANFNRQAGATVSTLGEVKTDVLSDMARDINPTLDIKTFPQGLTEDSVDAFLEDVDLYVDGLDFFAVKARRIAFAACAEQGIPAVTAAPLGMGTALLNFLPGHMTFEEYFRLEDHSEDEQLVRFLVGLSPARLQNGYLVDPSTVDLAKHRGPSTPMACELCAGIAATQALKLLLGRGNVVAAPWGLQFDAYRNKLARTWRPWGNNNPIQRLGLGVARRLVGKLSRPTPTPAATGPEGVVAQILDLARWAPSGDNTQPWRFEIKDERHLVVHGHDTREHCVYDLQGHASQISLGALLENIAIAATKHGLVTSYQRRLDAPDTQPTFDVHFRDDPEIVPHPLIPYIPIRSTQRRPMKTRRLTKVEKQALTSSTGPHYRVVWTEGFRNKLGLSRLLFKNAGLRLTLPEAFEVHRNVIQWRAQFSQDKIPDQAVGASIMTLQLMRWAMQSWQRVNFLNTYLGGTLMPRIEMDVLPSLLCGAHFLIVAEKQPETVDDFVAAGQAVQRFWLTATKRGLHIQPEVTPLVFHEYVRDKIDFSKTPSMTQRAESISQGLRDMFPDIDVDRAVFMGRIGLGQGPQARSTRLPLEALVT